MSLQKQLVHLNMTGGINQKKDSFLTLPAKLVELQNGLFDDKNSVVRRGGFGALNGYPGAGYPVRMNAAHNRALVEEVAGRYYFNRNNTWSSVGPLVDTTVAPGAEEYVEQPRLTLTRKDLASQAAVWPIGTTSLPYLGNAYDFAISTTYNIAVAAFEEKDPDYNTLRTRVVCFDLTTNAQISETIFSSATYSYTQPRVLFLSAATTPKFAVYVARLTSAGATTWGVYNALFTTAGALDTALGAYITALPGSGSSIGTSGEEALFDVGYDTGGTNGTSVVAVRLYTGGAWNIYGAVFSNWSTFVEDWYQVIADKPQALSVTLASYSATRKAFVFYARWSGGTPQAIYCNVFSLTGHVVLSNALVATSSATGYYTGRITAVDIDANNLAVIWDCSEATSYRSQIQVAPVNKNTIAAGTQKVFSDSNHSCFLAGRASYSATGVGSVARLLVPVFSPGFTGIGVPAVLTTMLANMWSQYDASVNSKSHNGYQSILARFGFFECGFLSSAEAHQRLPSCFSTYFVHPLIGDYATAGGHVDSTLNLKLASWASSPLVNTTATTDQLGSADVNGVTFLAGACPAIFDGVNISEEGFHHPPMFVDLAPAAHASGAGYTGPFTTGESYTFIATYEWRDAAGNLHQSAPSYVATQSSAFSGADLYLNLTTTYPLTLKRGWRCVLWRTLNGVGASGPYYRALNPNTGAPLTDSQISTTATDTLYTTGGVLENEPMPACRDIEVFQNRLFLSGLPDGQTVGFTSSVDQFFAPSYSSLLFRRVPTSAGRAVAARALYGRLIVLAENAVGMLSGTGPSSTGDNDGYSDIDILVKNTGCMWQSPRSAISANEGVWFQSQYGLRLFTPNGQIAQSDSGGDVGAEIDSSLPNTRTICAVIGPAKEQVWFFTMSTYGQVWAWSQHYEQWSLLTNSDGGMIFTGDACYDSSSGYVFLGDGDLRYYSDSLFTDQSVGFSLVIKTPWLSFAGIQGFQRLYRLMFAGLNTDASTAVQTVTVKAAYNFGQSLSTLVTSDVTPASGGLLQIQHHLASQKCETFQLQFEIKPKNNDAGKFRLSDITLQVGVKEGLYKLPSSSRI